MTPPRPCSPLSRPNLRVVGPARSGRGIENPSWIISSAVEAFPQTVERAVKRCIDISTRLGALEDEVPPAAGRVIVQCVGDIDEMQRWLEGRE